MGFAANRDPAAARAVGRYVLENSERIDVLVARACPTVDGERVHFDELWSRRRSIHLAPNVIGALPTVTDLIATKRFGARPKDAEDIRLLEVLRSKE